MKWRGGDAVTLVQTEIKESESPVRWGDYREHQCGWRSGFVDGKQWRRWTEVRQGRSGRELGRQSMGEAAQCLLPTHSTPPNAEGTGQLTVTANITDLSHAGYFP